MTEQSVSCKPMKFYRSRIYMLIDGKPHALYPFYGNLYLKKSASRREMDRWDAAPRQDASIRITSKHIDVVVLSSPPSGKEDGFGVGDIDNPDLETIAACSDPVWAAWANEMKRRQGEYFKKQREWLDSFSKPGGRRRT